MTTSRFEDLAVGAVAAAAACYLAWSLLRVFRTGEARTRGGVLTRAGNPGRLNVLIAFRVVLAVVSLAIAADLLLGLGWRQRL
jgi:hypothetical protein